MCKDSHFWEEACFRRESIQASLACTLLPSQPCSDDKTITSIRTPIHRWLWEEIFVRLIRLIYINCIAT